MQGVGEAHKAAEWPENGPFKATNSLRQFLNLWR